MTYGAATEALRLEESRARVVAIRESIEAEARTSGEMLRAELERCAIELDRRVADETAASAEMLEAELSRQEAETRLGLLEPLEARLAASEAMHLEAARDRQGRTRVIVDQFERCP